MKALVSTALVAAVALATLTLGAISPVKATEDDNPYAAMPQEQLAEIAHAQEAALDDLSKQLDAYANTDKAVANAIHDVQLTYYQAQAQQNRTIKALLQKQEDIFLYQDIASYVLLVIVTIVTLSGVIFAALELKRSLAAAPQAKAANSAATQHQRTGEETEPAPEAAVATPNDIKIGFSGIQITSALTGVTVLTISLAFLYLFLHEVYKLEPVRVPHIEDGSSKSPAAAPKGP